MFQTAIIMPEISSKPMNIIIDFYPRNQKSILGRNITFPTKKEHCNRSCDKKTNTLRPIYNTPIFSNHRRI